MASRMFRPLQGALDNNLFFLDGYAQLAADGSVASQSILGATLTKTGTAEYTLTVDASARGVEVKFANCAFTAETAVDRVPQLRSVSPSAVVVRLLAGATATEVTAPAGLYFLLAVRNSGVNR